MQQVKFNNVFFPSDLNGCGAWRGVFPIQIIWSLGQETGTDISIMPTPTTDKQFYQLMNSVMVQRLVDDSQLHFFEGLLKPASEAFNCWIIYNIDDAMHYKDIVKFNRGRKAFLGEKNQENIRKMLNESDFVLVTTDYIKNYYHERYGVPLENIIAIPNYIPRWWMGRYYDPEKGMATFRKNKNRPRVGFISSLSHFNLDGIREDKTGSVVWPVEDPKTHMPIRDENGKIIWKNERGEVVNIEECQIVKDDLDLILSTIERTVDEVQWVFFGYTPERLKPYIEKGKIECHGGVPIINYPMKLANLDLSLIVAPVIDCVFNRCKSNIKYLEAAAMGIPLFASDIPTYSNYMPKNQLFKDADDLYDKIMKFKTGSVGVYESIVKSQWKFLNSKHEECGIKSPNWWMEDNIGVWMRLFNMRKRGVTISMSRFLDISRMMSHGDIEHPFYENKDEGLLLTL